MKITPLNNRVLVKLNVEETKTTKGGLAVSTEIKGRNLYKKNTGVVEAIGDYVGEEYRSLKVGDEILFAEHSGYPVEDAKYRIIQDVSIEAKLTKGK